MRSEKQVNSKTVMSIRMFGWVCALLFSGCMQCRSAGIVTNVVYDTKHPSSSRRLLQLVLFSSIYMFLGLQQLCLHFETLSLNAWHKLLLVGYDLMAAFHIVMINFLWSSAPAVVASIP